MSDHENLLWHLDTGGQKYELMAAAAIRELVRERDEMRTEVERLRNAAQALLNAAEKIDGQQVDGWWALDEAADKMSTALAGGEK